MTFIVLYNSKLFLNFITDKDITYIQSIIKYGEFISSTQKVNGVPTVIPKRKTRLDYTLSAHEYAQFDKLIYLTISKCNYRECWRILKYDGINKTFRDPHIDWNIQTPNGRMSLVIGLTDPNHYEGGEFGFVNENKYFKIPKYGCLVFDSSLLHEVKPVIKGVRFVFQKFLLDNCDIYYHKLLHETSFIKYKK